MAAFPHNKRLTSALAALLAAIPFCAWASPVVITLREGAEVTGPGLRLGDVARLAGGSPQLRAKMEALEVGAAPLPGATRRLDRDSVLLRLRGQRFPKGAFDLQGPKSVSVASASSSVSAEALLQAVRNAILEKSPWQPEDVTVEPTGSTADFNTPRGTVSLKAGVPARLRPGGTAAVPVEVSLNGKLYKSVPVTVRVKVMGDVMVAARELSRHQKIQAGDIRFERREITSLTATPLKEEDVIGKQVKMSVPAGKAIAPESVEDKPAVSKGDKVTVQVVVGSIRATLTGIARSSAQVGQAIRVQNPDSKKELTGKVIDKGLVEVEG
ncbi:MAG: flagellar basal body P-ring formation protein FlgA [Armatimonadetes bacterium]|nr:flagellar basal body P-ring formation protein FlgA [Armatimonadota bacterium]